MCPVRDVTYVSGRSQVTRLLRPDVAAHAVATLWRVSISRGSQSFTVALSHLTMRSMITLLFFSSIIVWPLPGIPASGIEELDESHEGLADGPKAALDWAKEKGLSDKITALTDSLKVTSGYESVLETWLETRIESLLSEDSSIGPSLLDQIRQNKQGRVHLQLLLEKSYHPALEPKISWGEVSALLEKSGFKVLGELSSFVSSKKETRLPELYDRKRMRDNTGSTFIEFLKERWICGARRGWSLLVKMESF